MFLWPLFNDSAFLVSIINSPNNNEATSDLSRPRSNYNERFSRCLAAVPVLKAGVLRRGCSFSASPAGPADAAHSEGAGHRQLCLSPECPGCCLAFPLRSPGELCVQTSVAAPGMPQCSKPACHRVTWLHNLTQRAGDAERWSVLKGKWRIMHC